MQRGKAMQQTLMDQGIELMLYGMGTVFVFLALLILATSAMSAVMQRYVKPEQMSQMPVANTNMPTNVSQDQLVAVITAAVHQYRTRDKQ